MKKKSITEDPRIMLLLEQLGPEGYGILCLLEDTLQHYPGSRYPLELTPALARQYNTTAAKVETVIRQYGLFRVSENDSLSKVFESTTKPPKAKKGGCLPGAETTLIESGAPPFLCLPLNDKTEYPIYQHQVQEWATLYPAVNIEQELRKMKGWCDANPAQRKTYSGILRFINRWLAQEQDKGGRRGPANKTISGSAAPTYDLEEYEAMTLQVGARKD